MLFFFGLIIYILPNYASQAHVKKPSYRDITLINNHYYQQKHRQFKKSTPATQKNMSSQDVFFYSFDEIVPKEIQNIIVHFATNGTSARTLKEATLTTKALLCTNTYFYNHINRPLFSDNLIKDLATKYYCSHETAAKSLHTKQSKQRLALQYKLKEICCKKEEEEGEEKKEDKLLSELNTLISNRINLEFIYNHGSFQKTPLMITMSCNSKLFDLLLEYGADINGTNSLGVSPLHLSISNPDCENYYMQIMTHPKTNINQQNNRGETPLLYCLTRKKNKYPNRTLARIVRELITAGADPKRSDKKGLTPLTAAQQLHKARNIVNVIKNAAARLKK